METIEDDEVLSFCKDCAFLDTLFRDCASLGFSDREIGTVMMKMMSEILKRQKYPDKAFQQFMSEVKNEMDKC